MNSSPDLRAAVDRFGTWITGFIHNGERYGGTYMAEGDDRASMFVDRLRVLHPDARRILECGCLEGGHTTVLCTAFPAATISAVDVRPENLERARFLLDLRGCRNVELFIDDLDVPQKAFANDYDAVFCVGLLYHLRDPAAFIRRCAERAKALWLWTVYCAEIEATVVEGKWRGRLYYEPTAHPLSGVRETSFLPSLGALVEMCIESGFTAVEIVRIEETKNGNGPAVMLMARRADDRATGR